MITFDQIAKLFTFQTRKKYCVEIQFMLVGNEKYNYCWMGKLWDRTERKESYWYGLTPDGTNAYDYDSFEKMADAPVFDGLNLREVWDRVVIEEIDGCDPAERLQDYIGNKQSVSMMGAPK